MNPLDDIPAMGFLAENACRQLASAISSPNRAEHERLVLALRRFMHEAKKGQNYDR